MKKHHLSRIDELISLSFLLIVCGTLGTVNGGDDLATKCGEVVEKVIPCLKFATGKATTATKECCDAASEIKESNPECLCYIILQTHKGSPQIKQMGIQEDKLLHLPSACNLKNANITQCPKLLGLPGTSPDAAIFTNASKLSPTNEASNSTSSASYGNIIKPPIIITHILLFLLIALPTGFLTIYI
ncbi:putative bifunctional inhibitor/plant lipid transfer protein/seed storage helical [Lupinus albus]|uniref:Putative bifunctional inhibitor/plant lipid transfer protein/seed storage helical n=1 Tax=Lupinus albus TaxID=3870 RepID=A0A6A4Q301_LUPAL|nr:putative bifunctional inhibitor/plant lipid transfer protein/seed storage helical [Lupinus albus]